MEGGWKEGTTTQPSKCSKVEIVSVVRDNPSLPSTKHQYVPDVHNLSKCDFV